MILIALIIIIIITISISTQDWGTQRCFFWTSYLLSPQLLASDLKEEAFVLSEVEHQGRMCAVSAKGACYAASCSRSTGPSGVSLLSCKLYSSSVRFFYSEALEPSLRTFLTETGLFWKKNPLTSAFQQRTQDVWRAGDRREHFITIHVLQRQPRGNLSMFYLLKGHPRGAALWWWLVSLK